MSTRFSQKRQSILNCLINTTAHPSAEWVYATLKPHYPNLSLGTVYRNIHQLVKTGKIVSLGVVANKERFDARCEPHTHAVCNVCGKIVDVDSVSLSADVINAAQNNTGFKISYSNLCFFGVCSECANAVSENQNQQN